MKHVEEMKGLHGIGRDHTFTIHDESGTAKMRYYAVHPGISLMYADVHMPGFSCEGRPMADMFAINHCEEGRIECSFHNGEYLYMGPGDMSFGWRRRTAYCHEAFFPAAHYHGVSLLVSVSQAQPVLDSRLGEDSIDLRLFCSRFCEEGAEFSLIMQENDEIKHLFYELYHVPERIKAQYYRLKVFEILLFLSIIDELSVKRNPVFPKQQVDIVKAIQQEITQHMARHFTVEQLARRYGIAPSTLKKCFKGVYGCTIPQYIKEYRIGQAKKQLIHTQNSILEIANKVGYENGSKFAVAFQKITGRLPGEFRRNY